MSDEVELASKNIEDDTNLKSIEDVDIYSDVLSDQDDIIHKVLFKSTFAWYVYFHVSINDCMNLSMDCVSNQTLTKVKFVLTDTTPIYFILVFLPNWSLTE